ncbi:MAG: helix-turn-helix domain-containing protein [Planctomycetota bacterium]|nr:helix-turn-helix domain-containing protein [Planctomycetota bacterium]
MTTSNDRDILNIEEASTLLGVSVKTFNKVLHTESLPARKIGREWKFSRRALIEWVGNGHSDDFYRESSRNGGGAEESSARRTSGWRIELD